MPYTIFTTPAGEGLIPQAGRSVNTFPSGLVRVDQTYLGLTANAAEHRDILAVGNDMPDGDTSPCIDGLKIFPEAQERRREDGFTEYIVSAYGRSNTTGFILNEPVVNKIDFKKGEQTYSATFTFGSLNLETTMLESDPYSLLEINELENFPSLPRVVFPNGTVILKEKYVGLSVSSGSEPVPPPWIYNYEFFTSEKIGEIMFSVSQSEPVISYRYFGKVFEVSFSKELKFMDYGPTAGLTK
jgi:hypothetical protein